ncbi:MAG: peptide ABC transporter substrate-binding protein, partial [Desulfobacterales bacterium]|nr:peptide ABC transporter substrate-binding protein [Desulfobacterales bacterium]
MLKKILKRTALGMAAILMLASAAFGYEHPEFLRLPLNGQYTSLAPGVSDDMLSIEVQTQLFLALTRIDHKTLKPLPYLAKKWSASGDLKTYTFYLRDDARWTNGDLVTAHDVVWAVRHNISPETGSHVAYFLYVLKNGEKIHKGEITNITRLGVRLVDDFTLKFLLEHPASYFAAMAATPPFWPLPRKTISKHGDQWTKPGNIVTSGPYKLSEVWEKEGLTILKAHPGFFGSGKVRIPRIHYMVIEPDQAIQMYKNDEIDVVGGEYMPISSEKLPWIKKVRELKREYASKPRLCTYYYGFNNEKPPTDNYLVRRAVSAAIDREVIVDYVTRGGEEPAYTFTRPPIFGSVDPSENIGIRFDPPMARKWLAQAGYPDGENFPGLTLVHNPGELHAKIARAIRKQLKNYLNITVAVKELTWGQFAEISEANFDVNMFRYGWCADYPDANNWLMEQMHPTKSPNLIRWKNESFSDLVEKGGLTTDVFTRKRLYKKAERILCEEEAAIAPIYY